MPSMWSTPGPRRPKLSIIVLGIFFLPSVQGFLHPPLPALLQISYPLSAGRSSSSSGGQQAPTEHVNQQKRRKQPLGPEIGSQSDEEKGKAQANADSPLSPSNPPDRSSPALSPSAAARLERLPDDTEERIEVVRVPDFEEMLAWAIRMDARVERRRIAGLGGLVAEPPSPQVDLTKRRPLSKRDEDKMNTVIRMLSQRAESKRVFYPNEMEELREALRDMESLMKDDAEHLKKAQQDALILNKAGRAKSRFQKKREVMIEETGDFDPIYGSKEVRDQIYLYLWSLVKREPRLLVTPWSEGEEEEGKDGRGEQEGD
ncbi:hypothetical protein Naga_100570g2 [Nannochloropsis gaditana]|uniref:Transmembrane protein n=1 Tax=Nannochloropsis gaditana TaxID=72520 RepID=W7T7R7_9STRA|nr:hypothetical protein Naga_100570g2 [Nannochloropsis gaditana]